MQKKTLLTIAPLFWPKLPPLGLGYLEAYLAASGCKAEILDLNNFYYNLSPPDLRKSWLISANAALEEKILSLVEEKYPKEHKANIEKMLTYDIVGFSCFKSNLKSSLKIARMLKNKNSRLKIVFGGPEIARQFFKNGGCLTQNINALADFIVVGEGEKPLLDYLKENPKIKKLAQFLELNSLDTLPFPRYYGFDLASYPRKKTIALLFSRGCVKKCGFCAERLLYQGFRTRPVENVIEEIEFHRRVHKCEYFVFYDSMLNASLKKLEELCDAIINKFAKIKWEAQIAIRRDMGETLLKKMKQSGCYNLFIGLESGCDRTLKNMRKGFSAKEARNFFQKLNSANLSFGISLITGYPQETDADFQESLDFVLKNKALIPKIEQVNPFVYYDGTRADKNCDYKLNQRSRKRFEIFVKAIKENRLKYTNAFLGNLIEK